MTLIIGEEERYWLNCAPQCLSDILVQVHDGDHVIFTFTIGELIREEIEARGTLDGFFVPNKSERVCLDRFADQLEIYAALIRVAMKSKWEPPDPEEQQDDE